MLSRFRERSTCAVPGQNGKIVFENAGVLQTIAADGSGPATIPNSRIGRTRRSADYY